MESRKMIRTAVLAALVAVATMVVNVPLPAVKGFINVGDTIVLLAGLLFGPAVGAFSGAVGSSLADLLLGYAHWAPWTFVIKGLEGFLAGWFAFRVRKGIPLGAALGGAFMVLGYFLVGILFYGFGAAVASITGDLVQGGVSVVLSLLLVYPLRRYLDLGE